MNEGRLDWTPQGKRSRGRPRQITSKLDLNLVDTGLLGDPYELMFEYLVMPVPEP